MTTSQIPAIKTPQIWEYFGWTKQTTVNLYGIQPGVLASARNRVSIFHDNVFVTGIPPCAWDLSIIIFTYLHVMVKTSARNHDDKDFAKCYSWWFNGFVGDNTHFHLGSNIANLYTGCIVLEKWARTSEIITENQQPILVLEKKFIWNFYLSYFRCGQ